MKKSFFVAAIIAASLASATSAQMPSWSPEQTAVWNLVKQSWDDEVARNGRWPAAYAHNNMVAWDSSFPFPRSKESMERWTRFDDGQGKTIQHEIAPSAITVTGDTAVVHYTGVQVSQRAQDKPEREMFGSVETLVRVGGAWKFLSITGFDLEPK